MMIKYFKDKNFNMIIIKLRLKNDIKLLFYTNFIDLFITKSTKRI